MAGGACGRSRRTAICSRRRTPGNREGMAEMGGPTPSRRSSQPQPDRRRPTPSHWSLTFAVDDADATARRAQELGGQVVVPPVDAPWVRMTVISDPQGATFTASKFVPENKDMAAPEEAAVSGS